MTAEEKLLEQYRDSLKRLLKRIKAIEARGSWAGIERKMVKEIRRAVKELDKIAARNMTDVVQQAWDASENASLAQVDMSVSLGGGIDKRAMRIIAENAADELVEANHNMKGYWERVIGRHFEDEARKLGLAGTAEKMSSALTVKQAKDAFMRRMEAEGWTCFIDRRGRKWTLDTYAAMLARTTSREAANASKIEFGKQLGFDLVHFSTKPTVCAVCAALRNRAFSISGTDPRFPPLSTVPGFDKGFKTIHPNCTCVLLNLFWDKLTPEQQAEYLINAEKPFNVDPRSKAEVQRYNAAQRKNADRRRDRRQYANYKTVLGEDAPKSFSGFRAVKRADGEHWELLQKKYRLYNRGAKDAPHNSIN